MTQPQMTISKDFLAAIGAVTVEFAKLEEHLEFVIWWMLVGNSLEQQPLGRIVTAELSFRKGLELYQALFKHRLPARDNTDFRKLRARLRLAEQERNAVVHSTWGMKSSDKLVRIKTTAKGELKTKFEELSVENIFDISARIRSCAEDLLNFHLALFDPNHTRVRMA